MTPTQLIQGPRGPLECLFTPHPETTQKSAAAVLCHPHPLFGGTMHNKVVHFLDKAFQENGFSTARFNFGGVGKSAGEFTGGASEVEDLMAVSEWIVQTLQGVESLFLAGFSFGAAVLLRSGLERRWGGLPLKGLVTVAPAVDWLADVNLPTDKDDRYIHQPWLLLHGLDDTVVKWQTVKDWLATPLVQQALPSPQVKCLEGVEHYFHGQLPLLKEVVKTFLETTSAKTV